MPYDVDAIRPSGIKRKIIIGPSFSTHQADGTDAVVAYFPHGATLRNMYCLALSAGSANAASSSLHIGIAASGKTIVDTHTLKNAQAVGEAVAMTIVAGAEVLAEGTTLFVQINTDDADGGNVAIVIEYEDRNN